MPNHDLLEIDEAEHVHTQLGNSYLLVLCSRKEMLYAFDLKNHLRDQLILSDFEECQGFNRADLQTDKHIPNQIYRIILSRILEHEKN